MSGFVSGRILGMIDTIEEIRNDVNYGLRRLDTLEGVEDYLAVGAPKEPEHANATMKGLAEDAASCFEQAAEALRDRYDAGHDG